MSFALVGHGLATRSGAPLRPGRGYSGVRRLVLRKDGREYLPLYEVKLLGHVDHRFFTYRAAIHAQLNVGALPRPTTEQHDDPGLEPLARIGHPQG